MPISLTTELFKEQFTPMCKKSQFKYVTYDSNNCLISIKEHRDEQGNNIAFNEDEINEELQNIKSVINNAVLLQDNTLQFLLSSDIQHNDLNLSGFYKGKISLLNQNSYGVIFANVNNIIDISKIKNAADLELKDILIDNLYLCEITIPLDINIDEEKLHLIQTSIITDVAYCKLIQFKIIGIENAKQFNVEKKNEINTICYYDKTPLHFFLLAEKIQYTHFKYLEYYHIIEYYFMVYSKKRISNIVSNFLTSIFTKNHALDDDFLYDSFKEFMNPHRSQANSFSEDNQIQELFGAFNYSTLTEALNNNINDLSFLVKNLEIVKDTKIKQSSCFAKNCKTLVTDLAEDDHKKEFLIGLANRIYKIRNYIVHTKKGEVSSLVFHPSHQNLDSLIEDTLLIREIARFTLIKAASSREFSIN